ncbi:hypothetical protein [Candidatus Pelagibacter bacterium nBUS_29]|uniref:hypothetical protein n=1 Tax=Candidatus Pelagibacter bacterium nBUS_29 TaxID=3374190 RepID=UPI003EBF1CE7
MTCKFNYRGISLKNKTYSDLEELSTKIEPGEKLSQAKTVETMVKNFKSLLTNEEVTNENENHKKEICKR